MAGMETVGTSEEFDNIISDPGRDAIVVHFWAEWSPQCLQINTVIEELAKDPKLSKVRFVKIEAESVPEVSEKQAIVAVPSCLFFKGSVQVDRLDGVNVPELSTKVRQLASRMAPVPKTAVPTAPAKQDLESRLKQLLNASPVMLFMKGSPDQPQCGFSRQMIQILNENNIQYKTFDILSDDEVRQGLKKYSNWPTYPQLYSCGELLGGLDIVKELVELGELGSQLPQKQSLDERLQSLTNQSDIMLFMKGDRLQPRCGFSKQLIAILDDTSLPYQTFDILSDEEVRQGLKTFSDWPTYPQLYVKGDLVGGLDIVKELLEGGELEATLKGEQ